MKIILLLLISTLLENASTTPLIINQEASTCKYIKVNKTITVPGTPYRTAVGFGTYILYTLCPEYKIPFCKDYSACLSIQNQMTPISKGLELESTEPYPVFKSTMNQRCQSDPSREYSVNIELVCHDGIKAQPKAYIEDCVFNIEMMNPTCTPKCTVNINGQLIDFRKYTKPYTVKSGNKTFSLQICGVNEKCGEGGSICETTTSPVVLSLAQYQHFHYNPSSKELSLRGKKKEGRKFTKVFVIFKCDHDVTLSNITYKPVQTEGYNFHFQLRSSFACIKPTMKCVIEDKWYRYNLTSLSHKIYSVSNVTNRQLSIGLCKIPAFRPGHCRESSAQVCEIKNGNQISKGSIMKTFEVLDKTLHITFEDGDKFDKEQLYRTDIILRCSKIDKSPKFYLEANSSIFIEWETSAACPTYVKDNCPHFHTSNKSCYIQEESFEFDLTSLKSPKSYSIKTKDNVEFLLNICSPISDSRVPCMKDAMVIMRNLSEPNIINRDILIGKLASPSFDNGKLQAISKSAYLCNSSSEMTDYKSIINFQCSITNEPPQFLKQSNECTYEFLWKTSLACPKVRDCMNRPNKIAKNSHLKKTIEINLNATKYLFDICKDNFRQCFNGTCKEVPYSKSYFKTNSSEWETTLEQSCNTFGFNKTIFRFLCDPILNNDHFNFKEIKGCSIIVELKSNLFCEEQKALKFVRNSNRLTSFEDDLVGIKMEGGKCIWRNSQSTYDVTSLGNNFSANAKDCPKYRDLEKSVLLFYAKDSVCVHMRCPAYNSLNLTKYNFCKSKVEKVDETFCGVLENAATNVKNYPITEVVLGSLGISILLVSFSVLIYYRYMKKKVPMMSVRYVKDLDS